MSFEIYDLALIVSVSAMVICTAYLADPKWKALIISLPIPFSVATLSVGDQIDSTNVLGLILLLIFTHGVRILHIKAKLPIILAIIASALIYCLLGILCAGRLPVTDYAFWVSVVAVTIIAVLLLIFSPHRNEQSYRSSLPVWIKLPIVVVIVILLLLIKSQLRGFMTVFPMVGTLAAYEARYSLWTMARQIPLLMLCFLPMMIVMRESYSMGLAWSLVCGWGVFLMALLPTIQYMWTRK